MRIVDVRVRIDECLEDVVRGDLFDALADPLVALAQDVAGLRPGLARQQQRERVVLDPLAPEFIQLVCRGRPALVAAVESEALVEREIRFCVEERNRVPQHFTVALPIAREYPEGGRGVGILDRFIELIAQALEFRDVRCQQIAAAAVQRLEVALEDLCGHVVIQRGLPVMLPVDDLRDQAHDAPVALAGGQVTGRGDCRGDCDGALRS